MSVLVGALFLLSGAILLAANYLLVQANLPTPISFAGERTSADGSVRVTVLQPLQDYRDATLTTLLVQSSAALALAAALAVLLGRVVAGRVLRPVKQITAAARRLSIDNLERHRLAMSGKRDELTELADTFDDMLDRLSDAFDSQRRFVANASHELRTPLAIQHTMIEVALTRPGMSAEFTDLGQRLLAMNARSERLIEGLLVLAMSDRGLSAERPVRLDDVVRQVVQAHRADADHAGVALHADLEPAVVSGDVLLLEQMVANLVQNAIRHNHRGGEVWLRVDATSSLTVENTGAVVPEEALASLTEPFRRVAVDRTASDQGVGLGLSIVASVVAAHGGALETHARPGGGLTVVTRLG
ncbi:hypothetical protein ADK67_46665 [Saccharothrix sp. NRRL B-16348]|nr:hypothetical protein ADK67_46665 [Saccharothrix sp. NRRL B-16348]